MASVKDPVKLHDMARSFNNTAEASFINNILMHSKVRPEPTIQGATLGPIDDARIIFDVHNAIEHILKGLEFLDTQNISVGPGAEGHKLRSICARIPDTSRRDLSKIYADELVKLRYMTLYSEPIIYEHEQEREGFYIIRIDPLNANKRKLIGFPNTFEWFLSRMDSIQAYMQRYVYQYNVIYRCCLDFRRIFDVFKRMYNYSVRRWAPFMSGLVDASNLHTKSIIGIVKPDGANYSDEQGNCILIAHEPKRKANASFRSMHVEAVEEYFAIKDYRFSMDAAATKYYNYGKHPWEDCVNNQVLPFTVKNCSTKEQAVAALKAGKKPLFYPAFFLDEVYSVGNDDW